MHNPSLIPSPHFAAAALPAYVSNYANICAISLLERQPEVSIPVSIAKVECKLIGTLHTTRNTLKVMLRNAGWTQVGNYEHSACWQRKDLFGCPLVYLTADLNSSKNDLVELRFELKADKVRSISKDFATRFLDSFAEKICA